MAEPQIRIAHAGKVFTSAGGDVEALRDINMDIPAGQFVCLLGPSGCGKSTLLNAVAGFSLASSGQVLVDGKPVTDTGPDRGMVFQEYALFPWMTVAQNIGFGLQIRKTPAATIKQTVEGLLETLRLTEFKDRFPKDLSGGMRQRVAIARILALDSPIMLMDEPFGALDALTRRSLQDELLKIQAALKKTVLFVTHSIEESIYLADRIIALSYRPGTVKLDIAVDLPRPRDASSAEFNALKRQLSEVVMHEQQRHQEAEVRGLTVD
ncbi:NitT/TauT family transport system ATP-binding protein [Silvimonas terrae]|uniref:NitT/TauT family transport system ATP-binding protein n=1 Tax=Silvimonas terrae TaxID=300266 RepID=A0A840RKH6_9NEIS|nr:ABC transporter ATP-binding protein [Silvimonas terrae]MBB5192732.1 NitT/TauT family transport system ATP-binding protein [Silvimonas terrae]